MLLIIFKLAAVTWWVHFSAFQGSFTTQVRGVLSWEGSFNPLEIYGRDLLSEILLILYLSSDSPCRYRINSVIFNYFCNHGNLTEIKISSQQPQRDICHSGIINSGHVWFYSLLISHSIMYHESQEACETNQSV